MRRSQAQSGQVMPMVALLMVAILGMAALAIDGSNIYSQHRKLQAHLDVAVKVAGSAMFDFNPSDAAYTDTVKTAISRAAVILANDGYPNTLTIKPSGGGFCGTDASAGITICNPAQSGPYAGSPHYDYVEGRLSRNVGGFFSGVLGLGTVHISVRAVAWHGGFRQPYALIALDPNGCSISVQDTAVMTVTGSIMSNGQSCVAPGNSGNASIGGHSDEAAGQTNIGNYSQITGNGGNNTSVPPVDDPYSATPISGTSAVSATVVCQAGCPYSSFSDAGTQCPGWVHDNLYSTTTSTLTPLPNSYYYFPPITDTTDMIPALVSNFSASQGTYYFLPHCDGTPAVYYFTGDPQDMKVSGAAAINSINSTFVLDSSSNTLVQETGDFSQVKWSLHAPVRGSNTSPGSSTFGFWGIAVYENRPCNPTQAMSIAGGASSVIVGVIDVPCANLTISGDSTDNPFVNGALVGYDVTVAGNATSVVTYNPAGVPGDKGSVLVE